MKFKLILLMSLAFGLTSSSFFLPEHLERLILSGEVSDEIIVFAASQNVLSAKIQLRKNHEIGSPDWIFLSQQMANQDSHYAFELGQYYYNNSLNDRAMVWLKRAAEDGSDEANLLLANLYLKTRDYKQVLALSSLQINDVDTLLVAIEAAIALGDVNFVEKHVQQIQDHASAQKLITLINKYRVLDSVFVIDNLPVKSQVLTITDNQEKFAIGSCDNSVQLFATNINDLNYLQKLVSQFSQHSLHGSFCFKPIRYVSKASLNCQYKESAAIQCDETIWQYKSPEVNTRYLGILMPKGGANVHYGIMYLDSKDTVKVLAHELSHLLGFVDEYPLSAKHSKCQQEQNEKFSSNIAIIKQNYIGDKADLRQQILVQIPWASLIKESTPILTPIIGDVDNHWKLGTPASHRDEYGVFKARTCDERNVQAFKPLSQPTQLTYFELEFPLQYQQLVSLNNDTYLMPSFEYNIALSLFNKGLLAEAKYWLKQAAKHERNKKRKVNVLQGAY